LIDVAVIAVHFVNLLVIHIVGPGPHPAVIDLFGTVGGTLEYRSALLASRGFAALALPYFLYKDLPKHIVDVDLDYFMV